MWHYKITIIAYGYVKRADAVEDAVIKFLRYVTRTAKYIVANMYLDDNYI